MFKNLLKKNAEIVTKRPKTVLITALVLTLLAGILARNLSMDLNWVALAPSGSPAVKEYKEITEDFPTLNSIIVLVESDDRKMLEKVAYETQKKVSQINEYVTSVTAGMDKDFMLKNAMLYFEKEEIEMIGYMFMDPNADKMYEFMYTLMDENITSIKNGTMDDKKLKYSVAAFDAMSALLLQTKTALEGNIDKDAVKIALETFFTGNSLITSNDNKMTLLTIQPSFDMMDMVKIVPGVNAIESVINEINNKYDNVSVRATGMHIVARDETESIESDSRFTMILSLILILALLYFAFRSWVAPVFAIVPLIFGIIWSMGIIGITIGRLNMMTVFSVAMLLGLGVDYAIHLYSSYTEKRSRGIDKSESVEKAITLTGPSIIVGAFTTALAFFALNISKLRLLSELGTVIGIGIITTLVSVFWVLPSLIILKKEKESKMKKIKGSYNIIGNIAKTVHSAKYIFLVVIIAGAVFMGFMAKNIKFDMNLMNIEPEGLESIELMEYMVDHFDMSADSFAIQVTSLDEVYRLQEEFEKVDNVARVISIASIIPKEDLQLEKLKSVQDISAFLEQKAALRTIDQKTLKSKTDQLLTHLNSYEAAWNDANLGMLSTYDFQQTEKTLNSITALLTEEVKSEPLKSISASIYNAMGSIEKEMLTDEVLKVSDLPSAYKSQFVSIDSTKFMITVYPSIDIWSNLNTQKGEKFLNDLAAVDKSITGTPIFMKELYTAVGDELTLMGIILITILLLILLLHFKSIKYALLAFLPLAFTLVYMIGIMSLLSIDFNMINFLAILLIIGIGLDDGVHILHHYKEGDYNLKKLFSSIGRAIFLTTATTAIGFGSLSFSSYRGIAGLGIVLAIGVSLALFFTIIVLPIFLRNEDTVKNNIK